MTQKKGRGNNVLRNGRNKSRQGSFVRLGHDMLDSAAYASLSPNGRALLIELCRLFNGSNNGRLWLSEANAAACMGVSDRKTARVAFSELQDVGLIAMTSDAHFSQKAGQGRARSWALQWEFDQHNRKPASFAYRNYQPSSGKLAKRSDARLHTYADRKKHRAN